MPEPTANPSGSALATAACLLCSGPLRALYWFDRRAVAYCQACELAQLFPLPTDAELAALYGSRDYFEGNDQVGYADYAASRPQLQRTFQRKLDALLAHGPVRDLFEVGCGTGEYLQQAKRAGIARVVGLDRNPWAIEQVRAAGLEARVGSIECLVGDEPFDAAVMLDLIEHVTDPIPFLRTVRGHLRPGGRLFIMTPNIRSWLARVSGQRWVSFKIPEHVFYYSPRSIRALLDRAGFDTVSVRPTGQYVSVDFFLDRLSRLQPLAARAVGAVVRRLGWTDRIVFVTNGSIDVVARARPQSSTGV